MSYRNRINNYSTSEVEDSSNLSGNSNQQFAGSVNSGPHFINHSGLSSRKMNSTHKWKPVTQPHVNHSLTSYDNYNPDISNSFLKFQTNFNNQEVSDGESHREQLADEFAVRDLKSNNFNSDLNSMTRSLAYTKIAASSNAVNVSKIDTKYRDLAGKNVVAMKGDCNTQFGISQTSSNFGPNLDVSSPESSIWSPHFSPSVFQRPQASLDAWKSPNSFLHSTDMNFSELPISGNDVQYNDMNHRNSIKYINENSNDNHSRSRGRIPNDVPKIPFSWSYNDYCCLHGQEAFINLQDDYDDSSLWCKSKVEICTEFSKIKSHGCDKSTYHSWSKNQDRTSKPTSGAHLQWPSYASKAKNHSYLPETAQNGGQIEAFVGRSETSGSGTSGVSFSSESVCSSNTILSVNESNTTNSKKNEHLRNHRNWAFVGPPKPLDCQRWS